MKQTIEYDLGSKVACSDGGCGELRRVVVDPVAVAITHLVVESKHRRGTGHLVPIDLVASVADEIRLRCTRAEFGALEDAEETHLLPGADGRWGYEPVGASLGTVGMRTGPQTVTDDRVPLGKVEVRRGDHVHATDGAIGRVQGLVTDPRDHHVTHVLLDEGHLWGKRRVAISIGAVTGVDDGVRLSLTKDEVRDLPLVDLDDSE